MSPSISNKIYTAVLYSQKGAAAEQKALEEPLLPPVPPKITRSTSTQVSKKKKQKQQTKEQQSLPCLWRLKVLSFVTGSVTAAMSQAILSKTLWGMENSMLMANYGGDDAEGSSSGDESGLPVTPSTMSVVGFSLIWSFWTCVMIFITMLALVRCVLGSAPPQPSSSTSKKQQCKQHKQWEDTVFQMEAHHIVGALLSISAIWVAVDVLQSVFKTTPAGSDSEEDAAAAVSTMIMPTPIQNVVLFVMGLAWYALFVRCILKKNKGNKNNGQEEEQEGKNGINSSLLSTYQLIAATLGLISGLCSQFLLSFVLWKENMSQPIVDHVILFSLFWSFCTVVLTFVGCLSLRLLTVEEEDKLTAERIFLRMESHYIFCSLIGICSAWILIDLVMDMREQIFPSVLMLALSLAAFTGIVHCFPEEQCLADLQAEADATVAQVEREKLLEKAILAIQIV